MDTVHDPEYQRLARIFVEAANAYSDAALADIDAPTPESRAASDRFYAEAKAAIAAVRARHAFLRGDAPSPAES